MGTQRLTELKVFRGGGGGLRNWELGGGWRLAGSCGLSSTWTNCVPYQAMSTNAV